MPKKREDVEPGAGAEEAVHLGHGPLAQPAAVCHGQQPDAGIGTDGAGESLVAFHSRRGAGKARDFHHGAPPLQAARYVEAYGMAYAFIVGTDVGGVLAGKDLAVHHDDGDSAVVCLLDDGGDGLGFVGRDHQEVHAFVQEAAYVPHLLPAVVVGRADDDLKVAVEFGLPPHLGVLLVSPLVVAALGHADDVARPPGAARKEQKAACESNGKDKTVHGTWHLQGYRLQM